MRDIIAKAQIRTSLTAMGYTNIKDVEFKDGAWEADARSAEGNCVDLRVDATTGRVYPETRVANLTEADVHAKLAAVAISRSTMWSSTTACGTRKRKTRAAGI